MEVLGVVMIKPQRRNIEPMFEKWINFEHENKYVNYFSIWQKVFIKVKNFTLNFLGGKGNFECYSPPKRIK